MKQLFAVNNLSKIKPVKFVFWLAVFAVLLVGKLYIMVANHNFVSFSSDTMRHLFLTQEMNHLESIPDYDITPYVNYPAELGIGNLGSYVRGGHLFFVILQKLTGLETIYIVDLLAFLLIISSLGVTYCLANYIYPHEKIVSYGSAILLLMAVYLFHITPHYLAAYVLFPCLLWLIIAYQTEGKIGHYLVFMLVWLLLNLAHSNYAILFLSLFIGYALYHGWKNPSTLSKYRTVKLLFGAFNIYLLSAVYYFIIFKKTDPIALVSEYTGVWSFTPDGNNRLTAVFFLVILAIIYFLLFKEFKQKPSANIIIQSNVKRTDLPQASNEKSEYWTVILLMLIVLLPSVYLADSLVVNLFRPNGDLARLGNYPFLILFLISLYGIKYLYKLLPDLIMFFCLPLFVVIISVGVFLRLPGLKELFSPVNAMVFPIIDFSLPLLSIMAAYVLFRIIKSSRSAVRLCTVSITITALSIFSILATFHNYARVLNPHQSFISAYFWLKPNLTAGQTVGSNFEYLRALTYVEPEAIVNTLDPDELENINLFEYSEIHKFDYFILFPWVNRFPINKWHHEMNMSKVYKLVYDHDDVWIYKKTGRL